MSASRRVDQAEIFPNSTKMYANNIIGARKRSNVEQQKEVAMNIYKAPVVRDRYRKVISHFHRTKLSAAGENQVKL